MAALTPESIIKSCRHCLGGACTACISTALDEARIAAVTAYASGNAHVCQNGKLKPVPAMGCGGGCGSKPRLSVREAGMLLDARIIGWTTAKAAIIEYYGESFINSTDLSEIAVPESWSRLYETDKGEITG